jgi:hypothetical protein
MFKNKLPNICVKQFVYLPLGIHNKGFKYDSWKDSKRFAHLKPIRIDRSSVDGVRKNGNFFN